MGYKEDWRRPSAVSESELERLWRKAFDPPTEKHSTQPPQNIYQNSGPSNIKDVGKGVEYMEIELD
jgi:hypothetical protein